jgi:predicted ATP-binding protein involved in virulence
VKLKNVKLEKLFGLYDYNMDMLCEEYVTILHAPNGMGKTTLLKLIKAIIDGDVAYLDETPFASITLEFDNDSTICVIKPNIFESILDKDIREVRNLCMHSTDDGEGLLILQYVVCTGGKRVEYKIKLTKEHVALLWRKTPYHLRMYKDRETANTPIRDILPSDALLVDFFDNEVLEDFLESVQEKMDIHIIEADRLFRVQSKTDGRRTECAQKDSLRVYSDELKTIITERKKEKEKVSEMLDRTFPQRVLELFLHPSAQTQYDEADIRHKLTVLENKRLELEQIGLMSENETSEIENEQRFPKETLAILNLYVEDTMQKLKVYEELKEKLEVLLKVINDRNGFSNKKMTIDADEGVKFYSDNGIEIPLEKMSSGEKNDFILFYELIFKCQSNSLILIDEPEISLHIAWQQEFINELLEICRINDMQAIVATHSPNIVDEHWDLLCDMAGDE